MPGTFARKRFLAPLVGALLVALASVAVSWQELRFAVLGRTTDARVLTASEIIQSKRKSDDLVLQVRYEFQDGASSRKEVDLVPTSWTRPEPNTLARVQYIPGHAGDSRLEGHHEVTPLAFLVVSVAAFVGFLIPLLSLSDKPGAAVGAPRG